VLAWQAGRRLVAEAAVAVVDQHLQPGVGEGRVGRRIGQDEVGFAVAVQVAEGNAE